MMVIDSDMKLWPFRVPPEQLSVSDEFRDLVTRGLILKPLPFVKEVIFIATPHRGSYQALGILGDLASWFVNMPGRFAKLSLDILTLQRQGFILGPFSGIPTSITNMNPNNRFIKALSAIPIVDGWWRTRSLLCREMGRRKRETTVSSSISARILTAWCQKKLSAPVIQPRAIQKRSKRSNGF